MEMEKYEVRVLLRHIRNKTIKPWQQHKKSGVEGEGAVNERTVQQ
jgi:hypothetical protein